MATSRQKLVVTLLVIVLTSVVASTSAQVAPASKPAEPAAASATTSKSAEPAAASAPTSKPAEPVAAATPAVKSAPEAKSEAGEASGTKKGTDTKQAAKAAKQPTRSKLPNNLGTVTSTGSGGPSHYLSKHDAIAEKHAISHKPDKRASHNFGGLQKASGLGDMFSPFKQVGDSGLARTLGASMRSVMKSKFSVPAYVASALLGAVALLAFYESPMSPLPVPPLPEAPVGRFPPEHPIIPAGTQIPFRVNQRGQQQQQQQNYNQRSMFMGQPQSAAAQVQAQMYEQQQQAPQVLFPGQQQQIQQRQSVSSSPVQQIAANLFSSVAGKPQIAQRKSGSDFELPRSLFGSSQAPMVAAAKMSGPANSNQPAKAANSFLGFFGLGGSGSGHAASTAPTSGELLAQAANSPLSPEAQKANAQAGLSNSHLVNKVKSYFTRSASQSPTQAAGSSASQSSLSSSSGSNSGSSSSPSPAQAPANPYDQYQRMSFVQALMKDTAFIPSFLSPSRKSSASPSGSSSSGSSSSSSNSRIQSITNALSGTGNNPAARMQVDSLGQQLFAAAPIAAAANAQTKTSSGGLMKAADRLARIAQHALLETLTLGVSQRSAGASHGQSVDQLSAERKISAEEHQAQQAGQQAHAQAASQADLYSTSFSGPSVSMQETPSQSQIQPQSQQQQQPQLHQQSPPTSGQAQDQVASSRSSASNADESADQHHQPSAKQQVALASPQPQASAEHVAVNNQQPQYLVRKTRSIGLDYPIGSEHELAIRHQQLSKAAQINNIVDFVADSYTNNRLLFNFVMNQVGLSHAVPYVEQILAAGPSGQHS